MRFFPGSGIASCSPAVKPDLFTRNPVFPPLGSAFRSGARISDVVPADRNEDAQGANPSPGPRPMRVPIAATPAIRRTRRGLGIENPALGWIIRTVA